MVLDEISTTDKNSQKIKETKFIIFIPIFVTAICAWFDLWFNKSELDLLCISKTIYTYFFPSIASTMITLIIQKSFYDKKSYGIESGMIAFSSIILVVYSVIFVSCISQFNYSTSIIFGGFSLLYISVTWNFCLDKKITENVYHSDPVAEERNALKKVIQNREEEDINNAKFLKKLFRKSIRK